MSWWTKTLFRGQRVAKGHYECPLCCRPIGPGEIRNVKVQIYKDPDTGERTVTSAFTCQGCPPPK